MAEKDWTTEEWRRKLDQQAEESREYRHKLYEKVDLKNRKRILDVGCGTGAITRDIASLMDGEVYGIDIDCEKMDIARDVMADLDNVTIFEADALDLPFEDDYFDLVVTHITIIYLKDQQKGLNEIARVLAPGGMFLATLEPDYQSRIEYPENPFREHFNKALEGVGADLSTGRRIPELISRAGLQAEVGVETEVEYILIRDQERKLKHFQDNEWFLRNVMEKEGVPDEDIDLYFTNKETAIREGRDFQFQVCVWAIGKKPA